MGSIGLCLFIVSCLWLFLRGLCFATRVYFIRPSRCIYMLVSLSGSFVEGVVVDVYSRKRRIYTCPPFLSPHPPLPCVHQPPPPSLVFVVVVLSGVVNDPYIGSYFVVIYVVFVYYNISHSVS